MTTASNNAVSTRPGRHDHPPQPAYAYEPRFTRRVSVIDRAALHLGVALIKWGRRPLRVDSRARSATRAEQELARLERERAAERWVGLNVPRH
ncbi:MAG: hypothetical protein QOF36_2668 [Microbacteriaceae bacterium]|jgi:hypothetical protein|nr:hypothetical protein [Microbacteriaceae bacterium]